MTICRCTAKLQLKVQVKVLRARSDLIVICTLESKSRDEEVLNLTPTWDFVTVLHEFGCVWGQHRALRRRKLSNRRLNELIKYSETHLWRVQDHPLKKPSNDGLKKQACCWPVYVKNERQGLRRKKSLKELVHLCCMNKMTSGGQAD